MHVTLRSMTDPQNRSMSMATAAGGRIARRQLDVWEILIPERLSNVERLFIQTEKCYKMSCIIVFGNIYSKVTCYRQKCTYAMRARSDELSYCGKVDHDHPTAQVETSRRQSEHKKRERRRLRPRAASVGRDVRAMTKHHHHCTTDR